MATGDDDDFDRQLLRARIVDRGDETSGLKAHLSGSGYGHKNLTFPLKIIVNSMSEEHDEMLIEQSLPLLEALLGLWKNELGEDYSGYRNHVYRMIHFCFALQECDEEARQKIIIAGCFHDLGIWTKGTVDYLPPSIDLARNICIPTI